MQVASIVRRRRVRAHVHRRRDAVRGEDDGRPERDVLLALDEDRAAFFELTHDVRVVHDLLAHVDRGAMEVECLLNSLDCPLDAGAIAPRRGEEQPLDHRH